MASRTISVNRTGAIVGLAALAGLGGFLWLRSRRAKAAAAQQSTVSATAPAPVPGFGTNMAGVVDVVQGPPGTTARVTDLQTGQRVV